MAVLARAPTLAAFPLLAASAAAGSAVAPAA